VLLFDLIHHVGSASIYYDCRALADRSEVAPAGARRWQQPVARRMTTRTDQRTIPKSGKRFSGKIMRQAKI
jgi:hypothetical protein